MKSDSALGAQAGAPTFPLVNVVGVPGVGVLVEVATSPIESHRIVLNEQVLQLIVREAHKLHQVSLDIVRTIEKSKVRNV